MAIFKRKANEIKHNKKPPVLLVDFYYSFYHWD